MDLSSRFRVEQLCADKTLLKSCLHLVKDYDSGAEYLLFTEYKTGAAIIKLDPPIVHPKND